MQGESSLKIQLYSGYDAFIRLRARLIVLKQEFCWPNTETDWPIYPRSWRDLNWYHRVSVSHCCLVLLGVRMSLYWISYTKGGPSQILWRSNKSEITHKETRRKRKLAAHLTSKTRTSLSLVGTEFDPRGFLMVTWPQWWVFSGHSRSLRIPRLPAEIRPIPVHLCLLNTMVC